MTMRLRIPGEAHRMAMHSALYEVKRHSCATFDDVLRSGLCEFSARRALESLEQEGVIARDASDAYYCIDVEREVW